MNLLAVENIDVAEIHLLGGRLTKSPLRRIRVGCDLGADLVHVVYEAYCRTAQ